jgi:hypothetical protein
MADIDLRSVTRVIGMRMGDDGARNGAPGINVKVALGAIEPAVGRSDEVQGCLRSTMKERTAQYGVRPGEVELRRPAFC